jgi:hypothetical protein
MLFQQSCRKEMQDSSYCSRNMHCKKLCIDSCSAMCVSAASRLESFAMLQQPKADAAHWNRQYTTFGVQDKAAEQWNRVWGMKRTRGCRRLFERTSMHCCDHSVLQHDEHHVLAVPKC